MTIGDKPKVLVVDDDPGILDIEVSALEFAGFDVVGVSNARKAMDATREHEFAVGIFDVMLPDLSGFTLVEQIRSYGNDMPAIFVTAKDSITNKLRGFAVGGDDYVVKPFAVEELIARVTAMIKRSKMQKINEKMAADAPEVLKVQDVEMDVDAMQVRRGGNLVQLTPTELSILELLLRNAGRVVSKRDIIDFVWFDDGDANEALVDTYLSLLRKKIDNYGCEEKLIETRRGLGYIIAK